MKSAARASALVVVLLSALHTAFGQESADMSTTANEPPVGFIWHFPFVDVGTADIPRSGANAMASRASWAALEPAESHFDFTHIDRQLAAARAGGYKLMLILECNAFCSPKWVVDAVGAAGELTRDYAGSATGQGPHGGLPRAHSVVFLRLQNAFLQACIGHIKAVDPGHTITHYFPGIEWWFPPTTRYATEDIARFRQWLRRRYRTLRALNAEWDSRYASWSEVSPPSLDVTDLFLKGRRGLASYRQVGPSPGPKAAGAAADWDGFWTDTAAEVVNDLAARVKRLDPTRRTVSFLTFSFAMTAEWDYSQWAATSIDKVARAGVAIEDLGMQLVACDGDPYRIAAGLDLARKYGKPPMVLDLLDFARGVSIGPAAMRRATLVSVQHGARGLIYCCWNGAKDFNFHPDWPADQLRAMVIEGREALRLVAVMKPVADVALVLPKLASGPGDEHGVRNDPRSAIGWYKILETMQVPVDVLTFADIERGMATRAKYRWIVVPDCAWMSERAAVRLSEYCASGGLLVSGGRTPARTPGDHPIRASIPWAVEMPDYGRAYAGDPIRDNTAGDTPPMFVWGPDTPDRSRTRAEAKRAVRAFLDGAGVVPSVVVEGATPDVSATVMKGRGRTSLFLVNASPAAVAGMSVRVPDGVRSAGAEVFADLIRTPAAMRNRGGDVWVDLPRFERCCIVRFGGSPNRGK